MGDKENTSREGGGREEGGRGTARGKESRRWASPGSRAASPVVIQKNRVDEGEKARKRETDEMRRRRKKARRRRRKGAGVVECGRGLGICASIPSLCQGICVFMWNTPENPAETEGERGRESRKKGRRSARIKRAREEASPVKGKNEDGRKSQWPAKVCCPFVMRERVGR